MNYSGCEKKVGISSFNECIRQSSATISHYLGIIELSDHLSPMVAYSTLPRILPNVCSLGSSSCI